MCSGGQHTRSLRFCDAGPDQSNVTRARWSVGIRELDAATMLSKTDQARWSVGSNELTNLLTKFLPGSGSIIAEKGLEERRETKRRESDSTLGPKHRDQASGEQSYCRA